MDRFAQGDVLVVRIDGPITFNPKTIVNEDGPAILQHGEHTNHVHGIYGGQVAFFHDEGLARPEAKGLYLGHLQIGEGGAALEHGTGPGALDGDHATINLPKGNFAVYGQQEVSEDELTRPMAD